MQLILVTQFILFFFPLDISFACSKGSSRESVPVCQFGGLHGGQPGAAFCSGQGATNPTLKGESWVSSFQGQIQDILYEGFQIIQELAVILSIGLRDCNPQVFEFFSLHKISVWNWVSHAGLICTITNNIIIIIGCNFAVMVQLDIKFFNTFSNRCRLRFKRIWPQSSPILLASSPESALLKPRL